MGKDGRGRSKKRRKRKRKDPLFPPCRKPLVTPNLGMGGGFGDSVLLFEKPEREEQ